MTAPDASGGGAVSKPVAQLVEELRGAASAGYDDWRVQDPKDGSYCIAYSWPDTMNPEREAREWLANHKASFPDSQFAGYVVACVRVVPLKDRLLTDAADKIERLHADLENTRAEAVLAVITAKAAERERWQARVEQAFREGYWARETYNDSETSDADEKWASAKVGLLRV